jgi:GGDEF domain-containing protein
LEQFTWLLQWGNSLLQRHGLQSTLLAVRIDNLAELQEAWGLLQTRQRLDGLLSRLQAMLRDTDVMSQYADDILLVLLPKAGKDHWKVFEKRIRQLNAVEGLDNLSLTLAAQLLPARIGDDPGVWLSRWLDGEKDDA